MMLIASKIWRGLKEAQTAKEELKQPNDWNEFLKRDENKEQLFGYLSKESVKLDVNGQIISTHNEEAVKKEEEDT